jgi:glycosyltransferase involved in cell wall biosynthesis
MTERRVLFISYNFPPNGGPGVQRSLKFVKYLPRYGWQPLVITSSAEASYVQDPSLLEDIPAETFIERLPGFSIHGLYQRARRYKAERAVVLANALLQLPDTVRFWAKSARRNVLDIAQREQPDLIYSTSGPFSAHLLGRWLREQTGLPWLADFRDPWSQNLLTPYPPGYRWLNARLERQILAAADRVACVSQPWLDDLKRNLGHDEDKFFVLPNGYDEDDVKPVGPRQPHDRFTMVHYGTFYRNRNPDQVVRAVRDLIRSGRIPIDQLRVVFIGRNAQPMTPSGPPFECVDYVPHRELGAYREEADTLLLILDTARANSGKHSGKIYEYIASNRPILGVVPPGGVAEQLIRQTRTGVTAGGNPAEIAEAIETLYLQWKDRTSIWNPDWDLIRQYTRERTTQRLAEEFDRMIQAALDMS